MRQDSNSQKVFPVGGGVASAARVPGFLLRAGSLLVGVGPLFGTSLYSALSWLAPDMSICERCAGCPLACGVEVVSVSALAGGAAGGLVLAALPVVRGLRSLVGPSWLRTVGAASICLRCACWFWLAAGGAGLFAVAGLAPGVVAALWLVVGRAVAIGRGLGSLLLAGWGRFSGFSSLCSLLACSW